MSVHGGVIGCGLGSIFNGCRVQVIHLLHGLNRLVLLSGALFSSSLFGGGLFIRLFTFCNNLCKSVRCRALCQLFGRLHGDGNHRLLRMHRHVTGRHLSYDRLFRLNGLLRCYSLPRYYR